MIPDWLLAPPIGLTDAERRVLEGFFVAEEVKAAAELLRLSPKTIQNELLLARQTMGESKSWMAAIRYVFHAKRQGHSFKEAQLAPKIDRQIRRLIDDYLEATESEPQVETKAPESDPDQGWTQEPKPESVAEKASSRAILPVGSFDLVPEEQFESQLSALVDVAANIYERPAKRRKRRFVTTLVALCGVAAAIWGYFGTRDPTPSLDEIKARLVSLRKASKDGTVAFDGSQCAQVADDLCERYWREMWGAGEDEVLKVVGEYKAEIGAGATWAHNHNRKLALQIFGNGHRAFVREGVLDGKWFPFLLSAVQTKEANKSSHMVRALCGVIFVCLTYQKYGISLKGLEPSKCEQMAVARLKEFEESDVDEYDYLNAMRHIAMTLNGDAYKERLTMCKEAMARYEKLADRDLSQRGVAQCYLSVIETGRLDPVEKGEQMLDAYRKVLATANSIMIRECIEETELAVDQMLDVVQNNPKAANTARRVRDILWEYASICANGIDASGQFTALQKCLDIDAQVTPKKVPQDIQELVLSEKSRSYDDGTKHRLAGYALRQLRNMGIEPKPSLIDNVEPLGKRSAGENIGEKMSREEAIREVKRWKRK